MSTSFMKASDVAIGDALELHVFTTAQQEKYGFFAPEGPAFLEHVTVVGAFASPSDFDNPPPWRSCRSRRSPVETSGWPRRSCRCAPAPVSISLSSATASTR